MPFAGLTAQSPAPEWGRNNLPTLLKRAEKVPDLLQSQKYEIVSEVAQGSRVTLEAVWTGVLAIPLGPCPQVEHEGPLRHVL